MRLNNLTGILLLNLGTPAACTKSAVAKYLRQFLSDPRVIELPSLARWLLVNFLIVPFRSSKSAAAYAEIWQNNGSPLLLNSEFLQRQLSEFLGDKYLVSLGMRYGQPDIASAIQQLQAAAVSKIIVLPLFPQYSSAATGSALEQALKIIANEKVIPELEIKQAYYQDPGFIRALALSVKPYLQQDFDYLLMSYHGLPERQMVHSSCYRDQCYVTSRLLAQQLNLSEQQWGLGFQSRLGRLPWIKPYTDDVLEELSAQGVKKLVVCCPSFVVDCLETIEEIGMRAAQQWHDLGGEKFSLVPCLNGQDAWVAALAGIAIPSIGVHSKELVYF